MVKLGHPQKKFIFFNEIFQQKRSDFCQYCREFEQFMRQSVLNSVFIHFQIPTERKLIQFNSNSGENVSLK